MLIAQLMQTFAKLCLRCLGPAMLAVLLVVTTGCDGEPSKPRVFVLVLDETGSFQKFWPQVVEAAARVVEQMDRGDGMCVIAIDDHGFDPEDARIPVRILPDSIEAYRIRRDWAQEIRGLKPRSARRPFTDVTGTLRHADSLLAGLQGFRPFLVLFSDMQQTPTMPSINDPAVRGLRFIDGTQAICLFVNSSGWSEWGKLVQLWLAIFHRMNVSITAQDFCQQGNAGLCMQRVFTGASPQH